MTNRQTNLNRLLQQSMYRDVYRDEHFDERVAAGQRFVAVSTDNGTVTEAWSLAVFNTPGEAANHLTEVLAGQDGASAVGIVDLDADPSCALMRVKVRVELTDQADPLL